MMMVMVMIIVMLSAAVVLATVLVATAPGTRTMPVTDVCHLTAKIWKWSERERVECVN